MSLTLNETKSTTAPVARGANRQSYLVPATNIREERDGYVLEAEMPGIAKEGLELTVANGELVIVGHRKPAQSSGNLLYRESRNFDYRRAFELDPSIDTTKIVAKLDQGVLTVHLPKTEAVKPRKISVTD